MAASASNPFPFPSRRPPDDTLFYDVYSLSPPPPTDLPLPALLASLQSLHRSLLEHLAPFLSSHLFHCSHLHPLPPGRPALPLRALRLAARPPPQRRAPLRRLPPRRMARRLPPLRPHLRLPRCRRSRLGLRRGFPPHRGRLRTPAVAAPRHCPQSRLRLPRRDPHPVALLFPDAPSLDAGLAAVYDDLVDTGTPDATQAAIQRRIAVLPEKASDNLHTARVIVPAPVAKVLKEEPCLIACAACAHRGSGRSGGHAFARCAGQRPPPVTALRCCNVASAAYCSASSRPSADTAPADQSLADAEDAKRHDMIELLREHGGLAYVVTTIATLRNKSFLMITYVVIQGFWLNLSINQHKGARNYQSCFFGCLL